jgi:hypothetical protein
MTTMEEITSNYQKMIAEATEEYENRLNVASKYYYVELEKIHQSVNRQVDNLVNVLNSLSTLPKDS